MTIAYWCILAAALFPYLTVAVAKRGKNFDNARPRDWLNQQRGFQQRADWAHRNHFEAFPAFAAGVIVAELAKAPQQRIDELAIAFIVARVVFTVVYLADLPTIRSVVFLIGFAAVIGLFVIGGLA